MVLMVGNWLCQKTSKNFDCFSTTSSCVEIEGCPAWLGSSKSIEADHELEFLVMAAAFTAVIFSSVVRLGKPAGVIHLD